MQAGRIAVKLIDDRRQIALGGGDDTTLHFGGTGTGRFTLDIDWPAGGHQVVQRRGLDRILTVTES